MKHIKIAYVFALVVAILIFIGSLASWFLYGLAQGLQEVPNPSAVQGEKDSLITAAISVVFIVIIFVMFMKYGRTTKKFK